MCLDYLRSFALHFNNGSHDFFYQKPELAGKNTLPY